MKLVARQVLTLLAQSIRLYQRILMRLEVTGRERIPPGPKIFVTNHICTTDPYWVLPFFGEPVHIIIGPGYQSPWMTRVYDFLEQINAMPAHRSTVVDKAVAYLRAGDSVYTAPEGDLQEPFMLGPFFPGVGRIYRRARVPIIPIVLAAPKSAMREIPQLNMAVEGRVYRTVLLLRGPMCIHIGEPFAPPVDERLDENDDARRITEALRVRMSGMLSEIRARVRWAD